MSNILKRQYVITLLGALFFVFVSGCSDKYNDLDLTVYQYRDTKNLVRFVYDAALRVQKDGMSSLKYFRDNRKLFNTKEHYLYIYDMHGKNLYNAGMPALEGKNLKNIKDKNGKDITQLILNALKDKNNPHSWVHYSWWEPGKFYPVPKSSCHFKVQTPDGKWVFVGGGVDYPHEEKEFIRIIVDDAAQLIKQKDKKAFVELSDPISQYNYRDVRLFAFHADGTVIISPVSGNGLFSTNLIKCTDAVGHRPFLKALQELKSIDRGWSVFMARNRYQRKLIKKCLYLRKIVMDNEEIYLGAITDLPQPPY